MLKKELTKNVRIVLKQNGIKVTNTYCDKRTTKVVTNIFGHNYKMCIGFDTKVENVFKAIKAINKMLSKTNFKVITNNYRNYNRIGNIQIIKRC